MKNLFEQSETEQVVNRILKLSATTKGLWGSMDVAQMLAHCNVTYDMIFTETYEKPTGFKKFLLKLFVKNTVVSEKPYKKNGRTAPAFVIADEKQFGLEQKKIIDYVNRTQLLGASHFDGKASHSFGELTSQEWNNMFYKHLDHHLSQFGV